MSLPTWLVFPTERTRVQYNEQGSVMSHHNIDDLVLPVIGELALSSSHRDCPTSSKSFPDGSRYRIEIPSIETPDLMKIVIAESKIHNLKVSRVSQGSGIWLLKDEEITEMLDLGKANDIEVCLFVGPRAEWDLGAQSTSPGGGALAPSLRGTRQLTQAIRELVHACDLGLRCVLVADLGLMMLIKQLKEYGDLPLDLKIKTSAVMPSSNPASAKVFEDYGATSLNVAADLSIEDLSDLRKAVDVFIDLYIESPDSLGGILRYYDIPEIIRVASPVYLKFGLRNSTSLYPFGDHLKSGGEGITREKVRRAAIGMEILRNFQQTDLTVGKVSKLKSL